MADENPEQQDDASKTPKDRRAKLIEGDLRKAYQLLGGYEVEKEGELPKTVYLDDDSLDDDPPYHDPSDEIEARKAIVRLLLAPEPLDRQLRNMLAALFHPQPDTFVGGERRVEFKLRKNSRGRLARARTVVAREMFTLRSRQNKKPVTEAAEDVAEKYKSPQRKRKGKPRNEQMSQKTAMNYWVSQKDLIEWEEKQHALHLLRQKVRAREEELIKLRAQSAELKKKLGK